MRQIESYKETEWKRLRQSALRRDGYMDQYQKRYGKAIAAEIVHHIFPVEDWPEYQYCLWNLISVSKRTHNQFHNRNNDKLSKIGIDLLIETARKNKIKIPYKYIESLKPAKQDRFFYEPPRSIDDV